MKQIVTSIFAAIALSLAVNASAMQVFNLRIKDHRFEPSSITIPANTKVKLIVQNQDATVEEFDSAELHREKVIPGNSQGIVFIGPLAPGSYSFMGEFHQATAQGQIVVK